MDATGRVTVSWLIRVAATRDASQPFTRSAPAMTPMSHTTSTDAAPSTESAEQDGGLDIADEETNLVIEFAVPADAFVLADTLAAVEDNVLEFEQLVPTTEDLLPYLWVTDSGLREFEHAAVNDPTVASLRRVATLEAGVLYRITWTDEADHLLTWLRANDAVVLQAETKHERWQVKLRVNSRESLGDLQTFCRDQDIPFEVIRLYELSDPKIGQYNVSEKQRDILVLALEMGYFEIPREATLEAVAERLDISTKAASERLRRGQTNLLNNTLTIGEPSGVGVGGDSA